MKKIWGGIDPGKQGAIVFIHETGNIETHAMPMIATEYDLQKMRQIVTKYDTGYLHIVLEDVHAIFGSSAGSNFTFGVGVGLLKMCVAMAQIPHTLVQPKAWQQVCFEGIPTIKKPGKSEKGKGTNDTKAMALLAVQRLYPKLDLRKSERAEKPHDGIVDALLMAHYCKLKF